MIETAIYAVKPLSVVVVAKWISAVTCIMRLTAILRIIPAIGTIAARENVDI
jgi:hypothetical protein